MQWLQIEILAGRAPRERQCIFRGGDMSLYGLLYTHGAHSFQLIIKIDQSETTKNHIFNTSLKLTKHKYITTKWLLSVKCR